MLRVLGVWVTLATVTGTENVDLDSYQIDMNNRLALASQSLSSDIIYTFYQNNPGKSTTISILPLLCSLGELAFFVKQPQQKQLMEILNLNDTREVYKAVVSVSKLTVGSPVTGTPLYFGKVYADVKEPFCPKYSALVNAFLDHTGVADFTNPKRAAEDINREVVKQGSEGFDKLISSSDIDKNGGLAFISTLEILGSYKLRLDTEQLDIIFKPGNGQSIRLEAFTLKDSIRTAELDEMDATIYEFETTQPELSLVVFYPNKQDGIGKLVEKIRSPKLFNEAFDKLGRKCLQVTIPMMTVRSNADMGEYLRQVRNVSYIFEPNGGYFKGIQRKCSSHISVVLHETSVGKNVENLALPPSINDNCGDSYKRVSFSHPLVFFYVSRTEKLLPIPIASVIYFAT